MINTHRPAADELLTAGPDASESGGRLVDVLDPAALEPGTAGGLTGRDRRGMVSAEWAVGIIAAIAIAGVLVAVVTNGAVQDALLRFILDLIKSFADFKPR